MILKYLRELYRAPFDTIKNLFLYRHLLIQMIKREIKGRFAGSMGGLLWNFIHPVLMLVVYLFVFVYIFKLRVGSAGGSGASAVYLMAGLFPWIIFAEGLSRGTSSLIENAVLIQKTSFPIEILTAKAVMTPIISHGIAILLLTLYKVITVGSIKIIFILPFLVLLQILFTLGIVSLFAASSVFFRDVIQLVHIIISFWIYLTPILYPMSMLPDWGKKIMYLNPFFPLISLYQSMFVDGKLGGLDMLILSLFWSICFFVIGVFIFNKLKYEFADLL